MKIFVNVTIFDKIFDFYLKTSQRVFVKFIYRLRFRIYIYICIANRDVTD